jgi:hypothetical protein
VLLLAASVASLLGVGGALSLAGRDSGPGRILFIGLAVVTVLASAFHECGQQGERGLCGLGGPVVLITQVGDPTGGWRPMGLRVWSPRSRGRHHSPMPGW